MNPFIGAGALASVIDDYNGDNFDHSGLGFIGGAYLAGMITGARPNEMARVPDGVPKWGLEWKRAATKYFLRNMDLGERIELRAAGNCLSLDPTYKDQFGRPMLRMTFDFPENDLKMAKYCTDRAAGIAKNMGAAHVNSKARQGPYDITQYQTTHNVGGTMMGASPSTASSTNTRRAGTYRTHSSPPR